MQEPLVNNEEQRILIKSIEIFGERHQEDVAIEEMSELIKALIKHRRYNTPETKENILEELADVLIMFFQLAAIHGFDYKVFGEKINRLKQRMEGAENE